jgi:hypothetical protein
MKDLKKRTKEFSLRIIKLFSSLPSRTEAQVIGKQLLWSGTSVGAHYREAIRARSTAEFVSKLGADIRNWKKQVTGSNFWWSPESSSPNF